MFKAHNIFSFVIFGIALLSVIPLIAGSVISNKVVTNSTIVILIIVYVAYLVEQSFILKKEFAYCSPAGKTAQRYILIRFILSIVVLVILVCMGVLLISSDDYPAQSTSIMSLVQSFLLIVASTLQIRADKMLRKVQEQKILSDNE